MEFGKAKRAAGEVRESMERCPECGKPYRLRIKSCGKASCSTCQSESSGERLCKACATALAEVLGITTLE